jgi:hypothetical protein
MKPAHAGSSPRGSDHDDPPASRPGTRPERASRPHRGRALDAVRRPARGDGHAKASRVPGDASQQLGSLALGSRARCHEAFSTTNENASLRRQASGRPTRAPRGTTGAARARPDSGSSLLTSPEEGCFSVLGDGRERPHMGRMSFTQELNGLTEAVSGTCRLGRRDQAHHRDEHEDQWHGKAKEASWAPADVPHRQRCGGEPERT